MHFPVRGWLPFLCTAQRCRKPQPLEVVPGLQRCSLYYSIESQWRIHGADGSSLGSSEPIASKRKLHCMLTQRFSGLHSILSVGVLPPMCWSVHPEK